MTETNTDSTTKSVVRQLLLPLLVLFLGLAAFITVTATKSHRKACERTCLAAGQRYVWEFAIAPIHAPPCRCTEAQRQ
jgi:hypothetical protein